MQDLRVNYKISIPRLKSQIDGLGFFYAKSISPQAPGPLF